jgi:hypothetical protein
MWCEKVREVSEMRTWIANVMMPIPPNHLHHNLGMHPHIERYPSIWERFPTYWGTPIYGGGRIPIYSATPVYGYASPCTQVPQRMGMHPQILGYPIIWECISVYWGTPAYGMHIRILGYPSVWDASRYTGAPHYYLHHMKTL